MMLLYLDATTWTHQLEALTDEVQEALRLGCHIQMAHEFPSVLDMASARQAIDFCKIIDATPARFKTGPQNIYANAFAVALKGATMREPSLATLGEALLTANEQRDHRACEPRTGLVAKMVACATAAFGGAIPQRTCEGSPKATTLSTKTTALVVSTTMGGSSDSTEGSTDSESESAGAMEEP